MSVEVLLRHGGDLHLTNESGNTGLHIASEEGYLSTVVALMQAGADKTLKNKVSVACVGVPLLLSCLCCRMGKCLLSWLLILAL